MTKRPHTKYDKSDAEIAEAVQRQTQPVTPDANSDGLDAILLELETHFAVPSITAQEAHREAIRAINQHMLDTFMELIDQSFTFLVPLELGNIVEVVELEKLRKAAQEKLKP